MYLTLCHPLLLACFLAPLTDALVIPRNDRRSAPPSGTSSGSATSQDPWDVSQGSNRPVHDKIPIDKLESTWRSSYTIKEHTKLLSDDGIQDPSFITWLQNPPINMLQDQKLDFVDTLAGGERHHLVSSNIFAVVRGQGVIIVMDNTPDKDMGGGEGLQWSDIAGQGYHSHGGASTPLRWVAEWNVDNTATKAVLEKVYYSQSVPDQYRHGTGTPLTWVPYGNKKDVFSALMETDIGSGVLKMLRDLPVTLGSLRKTVVAVHTIKFGPKGNPRYHLVFEIGKG